ncbi:MAG: HD domain-containing protein [Halanaerobiales bacterium]|nr:HD domain-containing protein [Halanaerobiales bacterium]
MKKLVEIITELTKYSFKKDTIFLKKLFEAAFEIIPEVEYGSVYIYENGKVVYLATKGHDLKYLNKLNLRTDNFNKIKSYSILYDINNDIIKELLKDDFESKEDIEKHLIPVKESMLFNITSDEELIGGISLDISYDNDKSFSDFSYEIFKAFYNIVQSFYMLQNYNKLKGKFSKELALSMIHMLEFHDQYTIGHSENVAILASDFAEYLKLDDELISRIYWAGLVHDIGKIIVPSDILSKPGKLTTQEFEVIKNHPKWAFETLKRSRQLSDLAEYVLYHHENWDGSGYPEGLSG